VPFGNRLLKGVLLNEQIRIIAETFPHLYSLVETGKIKKTDNEDKWQMICGYAFHFWLVERRQNKEIQGAVERSCSMKFLETTTCPKSRQQASLRIPANTTSTTTSVHDRNGFEGTRWWTI
jgi:hypothetical protein